MFNFLQLFFHNILRVLHLRNTIITIYTGVMCTKHIPCNLWRTSWHIIVRTPAHISWWITKIQWKFTSLIGLYSTELSCLFSSWFKLTFSVYFANKKIINCFSLKQYIFQHLSLHWLHIFTFHIDTNSKLIK